MTGSKAALPVGTELCAVMISDSSYTEVVLNHPLDFLLCVFIWSFINFIIDSPLLQEGGQSEQSEVIVQSQILP